MLSAENEGPQMVVLRDEHLRLVEASVKEVGQKVYGKRVPQIIVEFNVVGQVPLGRVDCYLVLQVVLGEQEGHLLRQPFGRTFCSIGAALRGPRPR